MYIQPIKGKELAIEGEQQPLSEPIEALVITSKKTDNHTNGGVISRCEKEDVFNDPLGF